MLEHIETLTHVLNAIPMTDATDIAGIEPDGSLLRDGEGKIRGIIAFVFWCIQAGIVIWFGIAIYGFAAARKKNGHDLDDARTQLFIAAVSLAVWGGFGFIVGIIQDTLA